MRNVEIRNERNALLKRCRQLSIAQATLEEECAQFGPGKYFVTWPASKNMGEGKPRKRYKEKREVYVYDDDTEGTEAAPVVSPGGKGGVIVYTPRPVARNGFGVDDLRALLSESLRPVQERLEKLEAQEDEDEEDEEEDEDEEEGSDLLETLVAVARKPIYSPVVGALLSTAPDEQKFALVDQALAANPQIKQELFADALSLLPKDLLGV